MSRLARNVGYNLAGQSLAALTTLAAARFIFRNIGGNGFGVIYFGLSLVTLSVGLLDLGLGSMVVRQVAVSRAASLPSTRLLRTAGLASWTVAATAGLVAFLAADWLAKSWLHLAGGAASEAADVLRLLLPAGFLYLPRTLFASSLRGCQRARTVNVVDVGMTVLQQSGAALVAGTTRNSALVAAWVAVSLVGWTLVYAVVVACELGASALVPGFDRGVYTDARAEVGNLSLVSLLSVLHLETDKILVSRFLSAATFGAYSFASGMISRLTLVPVSVFQAVLPVLASRDLDGESGGHLLRLWRDRTLLLLSPLLAFAVTVAAPVLTFVFNAAVARALLPAMVFIAVGEALNAAISVPYAYSVAAGRADIAARMNLLALVTVLPVAVVLVATFGVTGAGISWAWYNVFAWLYFVPRYCRLVGGEHPRSWFLRTSGLLLAAVFAYGLPLCVVVAMDGHRDALLLLGFAAGSMAYFAVAPKLSERGSIPKLALGRQ